MLVEIIVYGTEVTSNLLALGFELTSDGAVARLPDEPLTIHRSSVKTHTTQMPVKSNHTAAVCPVASNKPIVTPAANSKTDSAVSVDARASTAAATGGPQQQSLYKVIRQRSQLKSSTQNEQPTASSSDVDDLVQTSNSDVVSAEHLQHEPSVKFCLEKNAFISASSAEESQCR